MNTDFATIDHFGERSGEGARFRGIGKYVGDSRYVHVTAMQQLTSEQMANVERATKIARLEPYVDFNVIKLGLRDEYISLLDYPAFFDEPFPTLARSWRVSTVGKTVVFRTYVESRNPPVLHRKELLLPADDMRIVEFSAVTQVAESLGLFSDPNRIGFREQWCSLIAESGYELVGNDFMPVANVVGDTTCLEPVQEGEIQRHRTALSRQSISAPVQALARYELLEPGKTLLDYGCGRGDDVRALTSTGIDALGWDPHFAPDAERRISDLVNIGFVINVIESLDERIHALRDAYSFTSGVLSVAAMIASTSTPVGKPCRDGYLTSRNTFQKYFTQSQLRDFIEHTLDAAAIAVSPGVFFVFKDAELEQRFLMRRYGYGERTWHRRSRKERDPKGPRIPRTSRQSQLLEQHESLFLELWDRMVRLGRRPAEDEVENLEQIEAAVGGLHKALRILEARFDATELASSRSSRISQILVTLGMQQFEKRKPYRDFDPTLQRDLKVFFGGYSEAKEQAKELLLKLGQPLEIDQACREAAERGLGWFEDSLSLKLHTSLVQRLPTVLQLYISCATVLYGDISSFDLVKIHIRSGKVSLLKFDEFETSPLPRLVERVKVKFHEQDFDIFRYGTDYPCPLLYDKSRFINEEYPRFAEQLAFEEKLGTLIALDSSEYGPSEIDLFRELDSLRWEVDGFRLVRSRAVPDIDAPCGAHFSYRQLIECGETWSRLRLVNSPQEPDSYSALLDLATNIIEPVIEYFGMVRLTYGFCSRNLSTKIIRRIAPELDQHASHEKKRTGVPICARLGAAVDFVVDDENMEEVARWIIENLPYDRLYFYGANRPIHVSYGPMNSRAAYRMVERNNQSSIPRPF